jgi:hypothetical protein
VGTPSRIFSLDTYVDARGIGKLARILCVEREELIPCKVQTKVPAFSGFTEPDYRMEWAPLDTLPAITANVAVLFGKRSRLIGVDCDTLGAAKLIKEATGPTTWVITKRGVLAVFQCAEEIQKVTSSNVLQLKLAGENCGELRLQRCFSVVSGIHPLGVFYEIEHSHAVATVSLGELVTALRRTGFQLEDPKPLAAAAPETDAGIPFAPLEAASVAEMGSYLREGASVKVRPPGRGKSSDAGFWCREAERLADAAPARPNGTAGTNGFILAMTIGLRVRPQLAGVVVTAFANRIASRKLVLRGGAARVLAELKSRLTGWAQIHDRRRTHKPLMSFYVGPNSPKPPDVLVRFFGAHRIRTDALPLVLAVADAFRRRAVENNNCWCYESLRALQPEVAPKTLSRVLEKLVKSGFLERDTNDLKNSRPQHLTARMKFRCTEAALEF